MSISVQDCSLKVCAVSSSKPTVGRVRLENRERSYYRARYYDPASGRFLNEDPIRFRGSNDFYAYTHNIPTDYGDPFGMQEPAPLPAPNPAPWWWPFSFPVPDEVPIQPSYDPWGRPYVPGDPFRPLLPPPLPNPPAPPPNLKPGANPSLPPSTLPKCHSGKQSKCILKSVDEGFCWYTCDDGMTVIDTSCVPEFYKDWGARH